MIYKAKIPTTLCSLNQYVNACRTNPHVGNKMKHDQQNICILGLRRIPQNLKRIELKFVWHEKNKRRDKDNVAFAKKFILDAMQTVGILSNDGWEQIASFTDTFCVNKNDPHVDVIITEVEEELLK